MATGVTLVEPLTQQPARPAGAVGAARDAGAVGAVGALGAVGATGVREGARAAIAETAWLARWLGRRATALLSLSTVQLDAPAAGSLPVPVPGAGRVRVVPSRGPVRVRRLTRGGDTPVLLLHGMLDDRTVFTRLREALRGHGLGPVVDVEYSGQAGDVRATAAALGRVVESVRTATGADRLHVVGYSLGGLVARYLVQCLDGDRAVDTLVTLGTPHGGTHAARFLPAQLARVLPARMAVQLRPGSDLLSELAAPAPRCRTRLVAYWSDVDQVVVPVRSARIEHPDIPGANRRVSGVGHLGLPHDREVAHDVCATLARRRQDPDPSAVRSAAG